LHRLLNRLAVIEENKTVLRERASNLGRAITAGGGAVARKNTTGSEEASMVMSFLASLLCIWVACAVQCALGSRIQCVRGSCYSSRVKVTLAEGRGMTYCKYCDDSFEQVRSNCISEHAISSIMLGSARTNHDFSLTLLFSSTSSLHPPARVHKHVYGNHTFTRRNIVCTGS
jgi:hypothetical protein